MKYVLKYSPNGLYVIVNTRLFTIRNHGMFAKVLISYLLLKINTAFTIPNYVPIP